MADPIRDAAERLLQQLELRRTDPDVPLALERAENDLRAALAAQPAPEVEPDPLQAALEKIRNAAEQASAAFKPLAELLDSLAAALPPDGPAVPEGREPAAVDGEPSDEELLQLMPEQFRADLSTVSRMAADDAGTGVNPGLFRVILNTGALDFARAILARWGRPTTPPATPTPSLAEPAPTPASALDQEVAGFSPDLLAHHLRNLALVQARDGREYSSALCARAAELISPASDAVVPVAVSERPWERDGWCDADGRCWWSHGPTPTARWNFLPMEGMDEANGWLLPHWAIPLPSHGGEVQP